MKITAGSPMASKPNWRSSAALTSINVARARTGRKLEIQSARAGDHCGYDCGCLLRHRAEMAMAFAELLNEEARARNRYLRMVVVGAHAVLYHRKPHHDALRSWAKKLMQTKPFTTCAARQPIAQFRPNNRRYRQRPRAAKESRVTKR